MARARRTAAVVGASAVAAALVAVGPSTSQAADPSPTPVVGSALGNGLGRLVSGEVSTLRERTATGVRSDHHALTVRDDQGRVLVALTPQAGADRRAFRKEAESLGMAVTATDPALGT